jgi:hypothetical protein
MKIFILALLIILLTIIYSRSNGETNRAVLEYPAAISEVSMYNDEYSMYTASFIESNNLFKVGERIKVSKE